MSDYDTMELGYAESIDIWDLLANEQPTIILIVLFITLASLVYGVTSWCVIEKFRCYKNFVFLNTILSNLACLLTTIIGYLPSEVQSVLLKNGFFMFLSIYVSIARHYWILVLSHMFYVDFVKVFNGNIERGYLKSCLFAWGVSLIHIVVIIYGYISSRSLFSYAAVGSLILPFILSCILYIIILYSLYRSIKTSTKTECNVWRRFYIATLIFVLCDISLVSNSVIFIVPYNLREEVSILITCYSCSTTLILDVLLVVLKTNRELWNEFNANKLNQKSTEKQSLDIIKPELSV